MEGRPWLRILLIVVGFALWVAGLEHDPAGGDRGPGQGKSARGSRCMWRFPSRSRLRRLISNISGRRFVGRRADSEIFPATGRWRCLKKALIYL